MKKIMDFMKSKDRALSILHMSPMTVLIMMDMILWISDHGEFAQVTSTVRSPHEDRRLMAKSDSHQGARAFDLHANSWSDVFVKEFVTFFTEKYKGYGATNQLGEERLIVMHGEGDNFHAHVQLNRNYTIPDAWLHL